MAHEDLLQAGGRAGGQHDRVTASRTDDHPADMASDEADYLVREAKKRKDGRDEQHRSSNVEAAGAALLLLCRHVLFLGRRGVWQRPDVSTDLQALLRRRRVGTPLHAGMCGYGVAPPLIWAPANVPMAPGRIRGTPPPLSPGTAYTHLAGGAAPALCPTRRLNIPPLSWPGAWGGRCSCADINV